MQQSLFLGFSCIFALHISAYGAEQNSKELAHGSAGDSKNAPPMHDLIPSEVIAGNLIPKGTKLSIFADHIKDKIVNPTALTFDEKGALYLVETHRFGDSVLDARAHRYWFLEDLASETVKDRIDLHKRWKDKVSIETMTKTSELVRKFVDTDADGRADVSTVFADGFNQIEDGTGAGVFAHEGKVYFACIPKLYILEDETGKGVATKREIIADGFGVKIWFSGHDLNGFALGNDGRIYATIGDRGLSVTTREGKKYHIPDKGVVMRFEPDGSDLEIIYTGLRNPKEIAFDEWGNAITVDNNSDQSDLVRVNYIMEGADSGWRNSHQTLNNFVEEIGLKERPVSMWMDEKMFLPKSDLHPAYILPAVANITNGPSGLTYHPGTGFLASEKGRFLICDFRGNQSTSGIWSFRVSPEGAGLKLDDHRQLNWGVAATDVEYSYDGRLFVTDFISGWGTGKQGQIYSLTATGEKDQGLTTDVAKIIEEGFHHRSNEELYQLMAHANQRIRLRSHLALAKRDHSTETLRKASKEGSSLLHRLHGLWGLGVRSRKHDDSLATTSLVALLNDKESEVRARAAECLGESQGFDPQVLIPLLADSSNRVKSFAAISLGRHKVNSAKESILSAIEKNADQDLYLRHALVMAMVGAMSEVEISGLSEHSSATVRLSAAVALRRLGSAHLKSFLNDQSPKVVDEAIRAIHELPLNSLRGDLAILLDRFLEKTPSRSLAPMIAQRLIHSTFRAGGKENAQRLFRVSQSTNFDIRERSEALRLLLQWADPHPVDQSLGRWDPMDKRDFKLVQPLFEAEIPQFFESDQHLLAPALRLIQAYSLHSICAQHIASYEAIAMNPKIPASARILAMELLFHQNPEKATERSFLLTEDVSNEVVAYALSALVKADPEKALLVLEKNLSSKDFIKRQDAWGIIAGIQGGKAAQLIIDGLQAFTTKKGDMQCKLEIVQAASLRTESTVKEALAVYQSSMDAADPLSPWLVSLKGGDPAKGKKVFQTHGASQCLRCHRVGDSDEPGILAGPNLSGLAAKHDHRYFLEALMLPGAAVAPGYGIITLTLKNDEVLGGILHADEKDYYDIMVGNDTWRIQKSDVKTAAPPISAMPPMSSLLNPRETRDLVAYLTTLKAPLKNPVAKPLPKPYILK